MGIGSLIFNKIVSSICYFNKSIPVVVEADKSGFW
jgi:hypothetical protein